MRQLLQGCVRVPRQGFEWGGGCGHREGLWITGDSEYLDSGIPLSVLQGFDHFTYDPFRKEPLLFRLFSELDTSRVGSRDAIVGFASKYGDLWERRNIESEFTTHGVWIRHIEAMRAGLQLADALEAGDMGLVKSSIPAAVKHGNGTKPPKHAGDDQQVAEALLDRFISERTQRFAIRPVRQSGVVMLRLMVHNLYDVLWLQFALNCTSPTPYRRCEECGHPFELFPQMNRKDRVFCRDSCRVKAYRMRRAKAVEMRASGKTLRQIAAELGSDLKTVKSWLEDKDNGTKKAR